MAELRSFTTRVPGNFYEDLKGYSDRTGRDIKDIVAAMLHSFMSLENDASRNEVVEDYFASRQNAQ